MISDFWAPFHVSVDHLNIFFRKMSLQGLCPFFNWIISLSLEAQQLSSVFGHTKKLMFVGWMESISWINKYIIELSSFWAHAVGSAYTRLRLRKPKSLSQFHPLGAVWPCTRLLTTPNKDDVTGYPKWNHGTYPTTLLEFSRGTLFGGQNYRCEIPFYLVE